MEVLFRTVLEISLGMAPVLALLLLCRPLFRTRYPAKWAYWVWLLAAVRLIIPLNFTPARPPVMLPRTESVIYRSPEGAPPRYALGNPKEPPTFMVDPRPAPPEGETAPAQVSVRFTPVLAMERLTAFLWLMGAAGFLAWNLAQHLLFCRRAARWSAPEDDPETLALFTALCGELGVTNLRLLRCAAVESPLVTGLCSPALLLPGKPGEGWADAGILRHELVHCKRRDLWYKLLLLVTRSLHWFNPLVHLAAGAAQRDLERACDEAVVSGRSEEDRAAYGRAILDAAERGLEGRAPLTSYFSGGKGAMLERLSSILNTEGKKQGTAVLALLLAAVVLGTALVSVGRTNVVEDSEFQITLPAGMTWTVADSKPKLSAEFYSGGVQSGGLEQREGQLGSLGGDIPLPLDGQSDPALYEKGSTDLGGTALPAEEWTLKQENEPCVTKHYYYQMDDNTVCDLWFRMDLFSQREARVATESFLKHLGAQHAKSPDGRYSLSYLLLGDGGQRWLLRERGEIVATATTSGAFVWQTAQWSPDGKWAAVHSTDGDNYDFALLIPGDAALETRLPLADEANRWIIGWGADSRLQFSYVRETASGLESGTAWYDPAADRVADVEEDPDCAYVNGPLSPISSVYYPIWSFLLPTDVRIEPEGVRCGAVLLRGDEEVGLVQPVTLTESERNGSMGLSRYYTNHPRLGAGAMAAIFPFGRESDGYELILREGAFRQDLAREIAKACLLDGAPAYKLVMEREGGG